MKPEEGFAWTRLPRLLVWTLNPDLRALAKMMLNAIWQKFGQRSNVTRVKEFDNPIDFNKFYESDRIDIRYFSVLTKNRVGIQYKHQREDDPV